LTGNIKKSGKSRLVSFYEFSNTLRPASVDRPSTPFGPFGERGLGFPLPLGLRLPRSSFEETGLEDFGLPPNKGFSSSAACEFSALHKNSAQALYSINFFIYFFLYIYLLILN